MQYFWFSFLSLLPFQRLICSSAPLCHRTDGWTDRCDCRQVGRVISCEGRLAERKRREAGWGRRRRRRRSLTSHSLSFSFWHFVMTPRSLFSLVVRRRVGSYCASRGPRGAPEWISRGAAVLTAGGGWQPLLFYSCAGSFKADKQLVWRTGHYLAAFILCCVCRAGGEATKMFC